MTKDVLTHGTVSSLAEICLESSLRYLESSESRKENTFLPEDICEALICKKLKTGSCDDDFVATYFADVQTSRITKVHVSGAALTDSGLEVLSVHPLREVDVSNCDSVSGKAIVSLVKCKNTLTSLNLSNCTRINAFTGLQHLTRLKSLDVSQTLLDQRDFECLSTMVHLFDYAYTEDVFLIETLSNTYGKVKGIPLQKPDISREGVIERTTPSLISINCFIGRVWYKDQPVICNSCSAQSHKANNECPDKNKCHRCNEADHLARHCTNAWGTGSSP